MDETLAMTVEGICPNCHESLEIQEINGTKEFIRDFYIPRDVVTRVWEKGVTEIGEIKSKCPGCSMVFYVFMTEGGDWV